jgi:hypothetical protein
MVLKMIVSGLLFACWPLLLNRSGLAGATSLMGAMAVVTTIVVTFALLNHPTLSGATSHWWIWVIASGLCSAVGMLIMCSVTAKAAPTDIGTLIVIVTIAQIAGTALYDVVMKGDLSLKTAAGFVAAVAAAILLKK